MLRSFRFASVFQKSSVRMGASAAAAMLVLGGLASTASAQSVGSGTTVYHPNPILMGLDYTVIVVLVCASLASIALIIDAIIHIKESRIAPVETIEHIRTLINARQFKDLMDFTATDECFVSKALFAGVRRAHLGYSAMREGLDTAAAEQSSNLFRRIEMLNVIGNIGPLIGLLGTVLGMIMAFMALHYTGGNAKVNDLSAGIATALWHTFGGLAVAIPSLIAFGFFRTKIDKMAMRATLLSEELLESLRPQDSKSAATPMGAAAASGGTAVARPVPRRAEAAKEA